MKEHPIGTRFGRWTVTTEARPARFKYATQLCKCDCGREREIPPAALTNGQTTKCIICARKESRKNRF